MKIIGAKSILRASIWLSTYAREGIILGRLWQSVKIKSLFNAKQGYELDAGFFPNYFDIATITTLRD